MTPFRPLLVVIFCLLPLLSHGQNLQAQTCSRDNTAIIQPGAEAILGGLVSLNTPGTGGYGCGIPTGSMQGYEAFRWVLDLLNKKDEYLQTEFLTDTYVPGIKLGMRVKNTCSSTLSAEAAVADIYPELMGDGSNCAIQNQNLSIGIVGGSSTGEAMALSSATDDFHIPIVSYMATTPALTMPGMYTNFMRTIPPDGPLLEVVVQVLNKLNWKFVVVVYDQGVYGRSAYNELHAQLVAAGICLTAGIAVDESDLSTASATVVRVLATEAVGVLFLGGPDYGRALIEAGNTLLPDAGRLQWIFLNIPLDADFGPTTVYQRGVISITASNRFIVEFEDHWIRINESAPSAENPWFTQWFENNHNCRFTNPAAGQRNCANVFPGNTERERERVKREQYQQDQFVESAVMAVFTYARALRTAQMQKCPSVSGVCTALRDMSREEFYNDFLKKVNFTFTADERVPSLASRNVAPYNAAKRLSFTAEGDVVDPSYYIWNYNNIETGSGSNVFKFRRVGTYISGNLDFNLDNVGMYNNPRATRLTPLPSSPCPARGCSPCLGLPADVNYYFEQGDVVINGMFSLHNTGLTPLSCGQQVSANHYMFLEAMIYAIGEANRDASILNNVRLGGVGFDDCMSSTLGQALLAQVQRRNLVVHDRSGNTLDPRTVEAYTAAYDAPLTLPLAGAMNTVRRPMVGYRASSKRLDDRVMYPYYLRSRPGIHDEVRAIILLPKQMQWMYVQVVTSPTPYSMDATEVFRDLAARAGICVIATHNLGHTDSDVESVVIGLGINSATPPTVALLEKHDSRRLLQGLSGNMAVRRNLALIGTSMWGTDPYVVQGLESVANDSITLSLRQFSLANFETYLRGLNVNTYMLNPWFRDWYMAAHNCTMTAQAGMTVCDTTRPITEGPNYMLMQEVESVILAVRAISHGLHDILTSVCGPTYSSVCQAFLNSQNKGASFRDAILATTFNVAETDPDFTFRFQDHSGAFPFEINRYTIVTGGNNRYAKVGDVNPWDSTIGFVSARTLPFAGTQPTCRSPCLECLYMFDQLQYWYIPGDLVIAGIFDIHYKGDGVFDCGAIKTVDGGLYTEVFNMALQRINQKRASVRMNGITLGGLIFDGCSNPARSTAIINRVHTGMEIRDPNTRALFSPLQIVNWMTYDSQTTIDAALLLQKLNFPIITPGATSSVLDDKSKFTTFFRTIPSDSVIVRGMAELANSMRWMYVIVLNAPDAANRENRDRFREYLRRFGICMVASYEFETDGNIDVILQSVRNAQTDVVAVFAEPDRFVSNGELMTAVGRPENSGLVFIANRPLPSAVRNAFFFDLLIPNIADFVTYLETRIGSATQGSNPNPWFQEIFEETFQCRLPQSTNTKFSSLCSISLYRDQDIRTLSTLNAVYSTAEAIDIVTARLCGANYSGSCDRAFYGTDTYSLTMQVLDEMNFTDITNRMFKFIERESNRQFTLRRYNTGGSMSTEGSLGQDGALSLNDNADLIRQYSGVESACSRECLECRDSNANVQDFSMIRGDVYIVGLFDVHKQGSNPFTCGEINDKHGLQLLEAFNYAIDYVNRKQGIFSNKLDGVQIGGIGLDMCQSPSRAASLVANIHSGNTVLTKDGVTLDAELIDAYVATMDTESSIRVADILDEIAIPQISYGATGVDLLDQEEYRFFVRSVPADDKQARAIVSYLRKQEINNIQVIASFDEIGEPGREEFKKLALANRICVKHEYILGEDGSADLYRDAEAIIGTVASRTDAGVVILWMKDPLPLLEAANRNIGAVRNVLFIATDKWGADPAYLTNVNIRGVLDARRLIILDVETADIPGFDIYLEDKTPANYNRNPWFKEFFEADQNCYWDTPSTTRTTPCDRSSTIPRADNYVQDPYVLYVINAVFSAAMGIENALGSLCQANGARFFGLCNLYRTSGERRQNVMEGLRRVNFIDDTHQPFFFTADGQSDRGFHVYNVTDVPATTPGALSTFRYVNVGSYNDTDFLKLDITYTITTSARCNDAGTEVCVCEFPPEMPSRYMKVEEDGPGLTLVYVGDVHQKSPTMPLSCGAINTGPDLQKLLAFFYAIERSNRDSDRTVKLDGLALDSCTHSTRLGQDVYNVLSGNRLCDSAGEGQLVSPSSIAAFVVDKDRNALPIASMLSDRRITTVSPTARHSMLADNYAYPYFLSTQGSSQQAADAILSLVRDSSVGWDSVSVIYTDSLTQRGNVDALLGSSQANGVCVRLTTALSESATLEDAERALQSISQQVGTRAVVLLVEPAHLRLLLQASRSRGLTGRFIWVALYDALLSEGLFRGYEQEAAGALLISARSAFLQDFNEWMKSLTYTNRRGIPNDWFEEIYQTIHQCNILNLDNPRDMSNIRFSRVCNRTERITDAMIHQDPAVLHVIISVFAIARGIANIEDCSGTNLDISACLQTLETRDNLIYDYIRAVNFQVLPELLGDQSFQFSFDQEGDGRAGFVISNYRASDSDTTNPFIFSPIGTFSPTAGLNFDMSRYASGNLYNEGRIPASQCAVGATCNCHLPMGQMWAYNRSSTLPAESPGSRFDDTWAIIVMVLACIGAAISACLFVYLLVMYPVRGGTSILGFILSFGIVLLYLMVFPFIAHADERICGLRRFGLGFVYSICYSALMVKLVDCWRVRGKDESYNAKYSKLGRPSGLFLVTLFFVLVQVMINAEWLILREPEMVRIDYNGYAWPRCTPENFYDEGLVLSCTYVMVIIAISLLLSFLTFTTTKNHRESRWICGILVLSIPIWVVWCAVSILGAKKMRDAAVAIGLLVNATVMLVMFPIRKLYLLYKYNVLIEEQEEKEEAAMANGRDYNSVYGRNYDNRPRLHDSGSTHGGSTVNDPTPRSGASSTGYYG